MRRFLRNTLREITFLRKLVRLAWKYYYSDPKFISLLITFEKYAPSSDGNPRLKSQLTKNTINGIFQSINLLCDATTNIKTTTLRLEDLNFNKDEKKFIGVKSEWFVWILALWGIRL